MSVDALQNWMMQTGLMVSLLILIILLIRRPFARAFGANAAYALWSLPLIRLCFPVVSIPAHWMPRAFRLTPTQPPSNSIEAAAPSFGVNAAASDAFSEPAAAVISSPSLMSILLIIWAGVAALWLVFQLIQQGQFKASLIANSETISDALAAEVSSAAQQMDLKASPHVRLSNDTIGPLVTGVINPVIILPKTFETEFETEQRKFALTHELAHLKRKDLWVALTALVFRAVNWPNPLVHFAAHRLRADQEAACDAYVVRLTGGEAIHSYAETLVKAAKQSGGNKPNIAHLALSFMDCDEEISKGD